jgi:hypothetical protein
MFGNKLNILKYWIKPIKIQINVSYKYLVHEFKIKDLKSDPCVHEAQQTHSELPHK